MVSPLGLAPPGIPRGAPSALAPPLSALVSSYRALLGLPPARGGRIPARTHAKGFLMRIQNRR
eukprot:11179845-Lingulodinium_polyedra.AAC.1